ncbi:hypothetical protein ACXWQW_09405, partial [Streptococcus pyogenes]
MNPREVLPNLVAGVLGDGLGISMMCPFMVGPCVAARWWTHLCVIVAGVVVVSLLVVRRGGG